MDGERSGRNTGRAVAISPGIRSATVEICPFVAAAAAIVATEAPAWDPLCALAAVGAAVVSLAAVLAGKRA